MADSYKEEILGLLGNMDLDSDPTAIDDGHYRYAKNIVQTRDSTGTSKGTKATLGNEYIIDIGSVTAQNKRYRIYLPINQSQPFTMTINLFLPNGGGTGITWTFASGIPLPGNDIAIAWQAATESYFNNFQPNQSIVTELGMGYVDFELSTVTGLDYNLEIIGLNNSEPYDYVVIRESISTDLEGKLIPIQSFDLNGTLFIWSTTQRYEETELDLTIVGTGPTSGPNFVGLITEITFSTPHGISVGQRIRIAYSQLYWCNGTFVVATVPNATTIGIPTELLWGGTMPLGFQGADTKIYIHPEAIGEIGVLTEDVDLSTYTYKRLIRTKDIPLRTLWTLDRPHVELNNYRTSFYFTDGHTNPKAMYYINNYVVDGFLAHVNGDNLYWYGHLADAISHIPRNTNLEIDFTSQDQDGGNLIASTYRYTARLLNKFLVPSQWSLPTGMVEVYAPSNIVSSFGNKVIGSDPGVFTGKINLLTIKNIDRYAYDFIEIGVVEYSGDSPAAKMIARISLKGQGIGQQLHNVFTYQHDGYEQPTNLALSDIPDVSSELFDTAENSSVLDSRMIFSNLDRFDEDDLTAWAKTFKHRVMTAFISEAGRLGSNAPQTATVGEYQDPQNVFRYIGYMDNEIYRCGVRLRNRETKKWTKVFLVDDISMDAFPTNLGNPTDNRRDQSIVSYGIGQNGPAPVGAATKVDWGLTSNPGSPTTSPSPIDPQAVTCRVHVTFVEFFGADMTTLIGGVPLRQKYDKIEFLRPDTITTVLSTGMCVQSVSHPANAMLYGPDSQIPASREMPAPWAGDIYSPERWKTCIYGENNKVVHEFPYVSGGIYPPDDPIIIDAINLPWTFTTTPSNPISEQLQFSYPLGAYVGQSFGRTPLRPDGTWDIYVFDGEWKITNQNESGDDTQNNWNFEVGNNRTALIAFPNILSLYCPDSLFGKIDPESLNQGRYKLRVMAINHEAIRVKTTSPQAWGRAFNMYSELHPYPADLTRTWRDYDIQHSKPLEHGDETDLEPFKYGEEAVLNAQSAVTVKDMYFDKTYKRNLASINLKKYFGIPTDGDRRTDIWQNQPYIAAPNPADEDEEISQYNPSPLFLWNNCPAIVLQMGSDRKGGDDPDNPSQYPIMLHSHSQKGSPYGTANGDLDTWGRILPLTNTYEDSGVWSDDQWQSDIEVGDSITTHIERVRHTESITYRKEQYLAKKIEPISIGTFYVQLVRQIDDPYGPSEDTIYREVCAEFDINLDDTVIPSGSYPIFGGDTFTQGTYIKNRYMNEAVRTGDSSWDKGFDASQTDDGEGFAARPGFGSAFKIYTQNRVNSQMRHSGGTQQIFLGDTTDETAWIESTDAKKDEFTYSSAYTPEFKIQVFTPFIVSFLKRGTFPTRLHWTEAAIVDALSDRYRFVPILNFKDLDLTKGEITWHKPINGELVSWQRNNFMRQFFNAAGLLQTSEGSLNVSIGDGTVMSRNGIELSVFGTSKREGIIYGRSEGGKDIAFWYNPVEFQFCRFGADGLVVISERQPIYTWIKENAKWIVNEDAPYEMYGIRGIWDKDYSEAIWTFTGRRKATEWQSGRGISQGQIRFSPNAIPSNFHQLPDLYRALVNHTATSATEPGVGIDWEQFWEVIPHTDPDNYTEFSIAWNEVKDGFSCFYTPMPRIYMTWNNKFVTTHPSVKSSLFLHRKGDRLRWWMLNGEELIDIAYVEAVHNTFPDNSKRYASIQSSANTAPDRVEFETFDQESFLDDTEFEPNEDMWMSPIKSNSAITGVNTGEEFIRGRYLIVRAIFDTFSNNTLRAFVLKYYSRDRNAFKS
jgi:hypothetical protein